MKRLVCLVFILVLLCGCGGPGQGTVSPTETQIPTQPPTPWIETVGQPWDAAGALLELPLTVPNGLAYTSCMVFDGDLMLWSLDEHRVDHPSMEICVIDLDTGEILAQSEIHIHLSTPPQVLGEYLYLWDNSTGLILQLDKQLNEIHRWETDIRDAAVYMGDKGTAYVNIWDMESYIYNLETGEKQPVLEENPDISYLDCADEYLRVEYYHPDTGETCTAFLDLHTGARYDMPIRGISGNEFRNGTWLLNEYEDSYVYTLVPSDGEAVTVDCGYSSLELVESDLLLKINEGGNQLSLHDLSGKALAKCIISEQDYGYESFELIPNEALNGYFVVLRNYGAGIRLLFWDPARGERGEDIPFEPVPEPAEQERMVRSRIESLKQEYGLNILVGEETDTFNLDFEAEQVTDWAEIDKALDTMEDALEEYPDGFFRQLRYGDMKRLEIHLAGTLTAINEEYTDTYEAFVQEGYDSHVVVMDIFLSDETTYYHEFSHVIDSFLAWDASQREGALFSDETWCGFNPGWFPGYTYSYSWEQYVEDYSCFVDSYSTINPTEDRARVLEYAMAEYGSWTFEGAAVLLEKLDYYCRCIRDAFDTTDWPEELLWEQYL